MKRFLIATALAFSILSTAAAAIGAARAGDCCENGSYRNSRGEVCACR
jgi:hypothetical protein